MPCKSANGIAAKLFMSTPSASQRSTWVLCDANVSPSQIRSNSGAKVTTIKVIGYRPRKTARIPVRKRSSTLRSEEHTSELQSHSDLVCRLLLEKKKEKWKKQRN